MVENIGQKILNTDSRRIININKIANIKKYDDRKSVIIKCDASFLGIAKNYEKLNYNIFWMIKVGLSRRTRQFQAG